jgi:hypothetical protein
MSALELVRQVSRATPPATLGMPVHQDWVDRVVRGRGEVSLVGGDGVPPIALEETAFWNLSVSRVYYTCTIAFGAGFGEQRLTLDRASGVLRGPSGTLRAGYAVVPAGFGVAGRVLAHDKAGRLVLVAPSRGTLRIAPASRSLLRCPS